MATTKTKTESRLAVLNRLTLAADETGQDMARLYYWLREEKEAGKIRPGRVVRVNRDALAPRDRKAFSRCGYLARVMVTDGVPELWTAANPCVCTVMPYNHRQDHPRPDLYLVAHTGLKVLRECPRCHHIGDSNDLLWNHDAGICGVCCDYLQEIEGQAIDMASVFAGR
jgi:hypothetical protein